MADGAEAPSQAMEPSLPVFSIASHPCKQCSKVFQSYQSLNSHMKVHRAGRSARQIQFRNFRCALCEHECKTKAWFLRHMRVHSPQLQNQFSCTLCENEYKTKGWLDRHMENKHPDLNLLQPCPSD